ncbi:hypothetical protein RND81_11G089800 [Saponaria officinalis]|uniref:F-box domain-containing protein n=1 Tax=Saponaria officinalis TaxID=3572 RepID=A0AAW1HJS4_SAPOF
MSYQITSPLFPSSSKITTTTTNRNQSHYIVGTEFSINENSKSNSNSSTEFSINENIDILVEILKRLDGGSLGVATCVCRLWRHLATFEDSIWEHVCFRHVSPPGVRALVLSLGGYKRLYMVCVRPVLGRVGRKRVRGEFEYELTRRVWTRQGAQLLLSLFCVDYYEKLGSDTTSSTPPSSSSLLFLCKPVNV